MGRRSYRQHCGLAAALDVVAQRWALLIVRDLGPGPRRFSDLFAGLPGISTDMLTERLRELEGAGAVEQVELSAPVPATVYQLTARGRELARIGGELASWGSSLLPPIEVSPLRSNARWALQSFATRYRGGLPDGFFHFRFDGSEELTLHLDEGRASVRYGPPSGPPIARLDCTSDEFFAARADPSVLAGTDEQLEGDVVRLQALLETVGAILGDTEPGRPSVPPDCARGGT